jgi:CheY-like chemotaxis protein
MVPFFTPLLRRQVLSIGDAYGGPRFWFELLRMDRNPANVWRALLYIGCFPGPGPEPFIRAAMLHCDTRVRAMACFASGCYQDEAAAEKLHELCSDASARVRVHARAALSKIVESCEAPGMEPKSYSPALGMALISDDSVRQQDAVAAALMPLGLCIARATDAAQTEELTRALKPTLLVTDNQKWGDNTSGLRVTDAISRDPTLDETVVLMLSADPLDGTFLWHGGDCFVHKVPGGLSMLQRVARAFMN